MSNSEFQQPGNSETTNASLTRRQILAGGAMGLLAAATAQSTLASTQRPVQPAAGRANPNGRFKDKVVLITGATSGIGKATAYAFAREGAKVFFCGRRQQMGEQNARDIQAFGGQAVFMRADVRHEEEVRNLVDACLQRYGRIDIAFNNAGIEAPPKTVADLSLADWNHVMNTNLTGVFLGMKYQVPVMLKQGGGSIVNTASVGGHRGFAMIGPYGASKAAVLQLTRVAALEYADKNIRINSISPGAVDTEMLRRAVGSWGLTPQAAAEPYPIKRLATAEEMARSVMYLCSDEASIVTGTDLDATGGYLTR
jgi:NAD(P)-dependent dehydrogenase (short-subunit alcohol dehydrogenase family)